MRAVRLIIRFFAVSLHLGFGLLGYLFARVRAGSLTPEERAHLRGQWLSRTLEALGAAFVKLGQVMSTRPDLLGAEIAAELASLQDGVRPFPYSQVERLLETELGENRSRIARIDREPLAAASVAQVHRAVLDTGEEVAIKVQRPKAAGEVDRDLVLLRIAAS
ncbi:MAG: AarF/ABC1/UbiB kinase family protein, partial [Polyangiaceae bacterium]|nr:AarF/ABC1/UbiB kinase family protein [Polyangiaceae bacterium]